MKRQWLRYSALGIVLYLVFLIVTAPAVWMAWVAVRFSRGVVSLNQPEGTLWHGRGDLVIHDASSPPKRLGRIRWTVNPLWFIAGRIQMHTTVNGPGTDVDGDLRLGYRQITLAGLSASFPAQLITVFYSPATLFNPSGRVHVSAKQFTLDRSSARGNTIIQWESAATSLSSVRPLGNYRLSLDGRGKTATLQLETLNGDLALSGQGQWQVTSGQFQFNGVAKPLAHATELGPLLQLFGPDTGGGQRRIAVTSRLSLP